MACTERLLECLLETRGCEHITHIQTQWARDTQQTRRQALKLNPCTHIPQHTIGNYGRKHPCTRDAILHTRTTLRAAAARLVEAHESNGGHEKRGAVGAASTGGRPGHRGPNIMSVCVNASGGGNTCHHPHMHMHMHTCGCTSTTYAQPASHLSSSRRSGLCGWWQPSVPRPWAYPLGYGSWR